MNIKQIEAGDVLALGEREEDHFFDKKALAVDGRKVQKIAVALANADGGAFVIGVADSKEEPDAGKRWKGAPNVEAFNGHIQALSEISPTLDAVYTVLSCPSAPGLVLQIDIEKSSHVHKTADSTVYVRKGAQSIPLKDPQKIIELSFAKGATSYEDQPIEDALAEDLVESNEIKRFLSGFSPKSDPLEYAVNQNLVRRTDWKPKASGVLLFANTPSGLMPKKCAVRISRYETKEDEPEREHLKHAQTVEGPLYPLIHDTVNTVVGIMSDIKIWTVDGLQAIKYPPEAVWEIIVNAIIHRDYSISDDIQIRIFNNRIEIVSPGRLPGYVTPENIFEARYSRNPKIVRTLSRYKEPPNKDLGEGLKTAFQKMKQWKLKAPDIVEQQNTVIVTISHIPLAKPSEAILEFLGKNPQITNKQAREITGIKSENQMKNEFYKLRDEGLLEMVPELKGSAAAWRLTKKS